MTETVDGLLHQLTQLNLIHLYDQVLATKKTFWENSVKVALIAPVSGGKSTMLSGLMHGRYLASCNAVETSFVVRITPDTVTQLLTTDGSILATGYENIRPKIRELNKLVRQGKSDICELVLKIPMPLLQCHDLENCMIELLDSPGPNEGNISETIKQRTTEIYNTADVFILLHDYARFGIGYQDTMMRELDALNLLQREEVTRVYHCINMHGDDEHRMEGDMDEAESVELVSEFLQGYGIENPQVFVVNALYAMFSRTILNDAIVDPRNTNDFKNHLRLYNFTEEEVRTEAKRYLELSGIAQFEDAVFDQILKDDLRIKRDRFILEISQVLDTAELAKHLITQYNTAYNHINCAELVLNDIEINIQEYKEYADANGYLNNLLLSYYQGYQQQLIRIFTNICNIVGDSGFVLSNVNIPAPDINALVISSIGSDTETYDEIERSVRQVPTEETYYENVRKEVGRTSKLYILFGPREAIMADIPEPRKRIVDKPQEYDRVISKERNIYTVDVNDAAESIKVHVLSTLASVKARWLKELNDKVISGNYPDEDTKRFIMQNYTMEHPIMHTDFAKYRKM
eukprot:TRINITY_DN254_c0_g1_i1.p1 TRINITY_DN254_c0_g1~~TRINITY_DN254_c0_g1_i1.p1  ORF type:complete len:575 (+),score=97.84 TRINITY_DN254_c0_g1_i1:86-1810(+)